MKLTVRITSIDGAPTSIGSVNGRSVAIDQAVPAGRSGEGMSWRELLCLAAGAGYAEELRREATRRQIRIDRVHVTVEADEHRLSDLTITLRVEADADEATMMEAIEHADRVAEALKMFRLGTLVRLAHVQVLARR